MENTSGQGKGAMVPAEVARWNWGAFLLNWIWGIGNNTFIALLMFVPLVNIAMPFVLGAKGSAWAWRNKRWDGVEHFRRVQRRWAIWGVIIYLALIAILGVAAFSAMMILKQSELYRAAATRVQSSAEAISALGEPISTGLPWGSIEVSGPKGKADFSFSADGSRSKGIVYVDASRDLGQWKFNRIELEVAGRPDRIDLNR
jgi:hypothetical protein